MAAQESFEPKPGVCYMEVPRCDRCIHWQPFTSKSATMGDCLLFLTYCMDTPGHLGKRPMLIPTATVSGSAKIVTYAEFGCVQFEER